jgi:MFS family permease
VVGGALVASLGWRAIFWINVPVGLAAVLLTARFVPESRAEHPRRVDRVGHLLILALLASLTYAIIEGPNAGWGSVKIVGFFAIAAAALVGLVGYESRREEPLLDLRFFRSAPFSGATLIAVSGFGALSGFLFLNTLYLQEVRGLSALHAGLYTLPMAAMTVVFAPLSGRLVGSRGPRLPLLLAGAVITLSILPFTQLTGRTSVTWLVAGYIGFGFGFGMLNAPITNTAVAGMPRSQAGVAAAIASTSRQVGQSLGVAVVGSAVTAGVRPPVSAHFAQASHVGWWIVVGCGVVVFILGALTTGRWARRTAEVAAVRIATTQPATPVGAR